MKNKIVPEDGSELSNTIISIKLIIEVLKPKWTYELLYNVSIHPFSKAAMLIELNIEDATLARCLKKMIDNRLVEYVQTEKNATTWEIRITIYGMKILKGEFADLAESGKTHQEMMDGK